MGAPPPVPTDSCHILVVDQDALTAAMLAAQLANDDHRVSIARSLSRARTNCSTSIVHLAIINDCTDGTTKFDIAAALRHDFGVRSLLSSRPSGAAEISAAIAVGALGFIDQSDSQGTLSTVRLALSLTRELNSFARQQIELRAALRAQLSNCVCNPHAASMLRTIEA